MPTNLSLDELMRYVISGGFGIIVHFVAFVEPIDQLDDVSAANIGGVGFVFLSLVLGAVTYGVHRAVIWPTFLPFLVHISGRYGSISDHDVNRWIRQKNNKSVQNRMTEWGAQIHLLGTCALSGTVGMLLGKRAGLEESPQYWPMIVVLFSIGISAIVTAIRYQLREGKIEILESRKSWNSNDQAEK